MLKRKAAVENVNKFVRRVKAQEVAPETPAEGGGEGVTEIEDEIEGGEPEQSVEERVEDLEETLETVVEGLEDQKEVIEEVLEGEPGGEDTFEDFLDDKDEEDKEEMSTDEVGLGDMQISRKMSLRERRKSLLDRKSEEKGNSIYNTPVHKTLNDQWGLENDRKKRFGPIQPEVPKGTVPKHEMPDMYKVAELSLEQSADKSSWILLNKDDKPLCEIHKGSVSAEEFASPAFAKRIILEMQKHGIKETLRKYKAKKFIKKTESAPAKSEKPKTVAADFRRRYVRALSLALEAMNKNLTADVPLKAALYESLEELDVPNARTVIEAAFAKGARAHFKVALAEAEKYLDMTDAAFLEVEAAIKGTGVAVVASEEDTVRTVQHARAEELKRRATENSLPFNTVSEDINPGAERADRLANWAPKPTLFQAAKQHFGN